VERLLSIDDDWALAVRAPYEDVKRVFHTLVNRGGHADLSDDEPGRKKPLAERAA
jgi:hypothetical protein